MSGAGRAAGSAARARRGSPLAARTGEETDMKAIRRIVLGVDFTDAAQSALLEANVLARTLGAEVILTHAIEVPETSVLREHATKLIERIASDLEADEVKVLRPLLVREGAASDVVLTAARDVEGDLIVVGAGEKTTLDRVLLGSTAERIARESLVPVWLTRPGKEHRGLDRIVCAVDGSDVAREALAAAAFLCRTFTARLDILSVTNATTTPAPREYVLDLTKGAARGVGPSGAGAAVDALLAGLDLHGIEHRVVQRAGKPANRIVEATDDLGADLLVIGSAGRRGVSRLVRGNTAEKVIRHVHCSTLVVPRQA
jgi:universal stress protein E